MALVGADIAESAATRGAPPSASKAAPPQEQTSPETFIADALLAVGLHHRRCDSRKADRGRVPSPRATTRAPRTIDPAPMQQAVSLWGVAHTCALQRQLQTGRPHQQWQAQALERATCCTMLHTLPQRRRQMSNAPPTPVQAVECRLQLQWLHMQARCQRPACAPRRKCC